MLGMRQPFTWCCCRSARSRFSEEQIIAILKEAEGEPVKNQLPSISRSQLRIKRAANGASAITFRSKLRSTFIFSRKDVRERSHPSYTAGTKTMKKNETTAITEEKKTPCQLKNIKGMAIGKDRIERFQVSFRGEVIQPADFAYEKARKIWNASIDKHPVIIARCPGVERGTSER
jgi:hypothetical protein